MRDVFCNLQLSTTPTTTTPTATTAGTPVTTKQIATTKTPPTLISSNFSVLLNNNKITTTPATTLTAIVLTPTITTTTATNIMTNICSSDSFSIIPPPHIDMLSANSIELNAAASLSDDSGVPLTTNSSISSGDSYRMGMCKLEIELGESDGEVSQFDSLDNCSEGGMSAENFNTLKKGPLAPIDPPPEFQDSPQTTLVRSISKNIFNSLRRWTSSQSSFEHLKDHNGEDEPAPVNALLLPLKLVDNQEYSQPFENTEEHLLYPQHYQTQTTNLCSGSSSSVGNTTLNMANITIQDYSESNKCLRDAYAINKHLYSSDSILNSHSENIYDEPNNVGSNSLGNSVDVFEETEVSVSPSLPPPPPPVSIVKIKQTLCPYYQDHTRYFKAIPSEQDYITSAAQRFDLSGLSEIHDYDLYYGSSRRNTYHQQYDTYLQRKLLSPLNLTTLHHCHHHGHYYAGVNSYSNRPNSRNSLNSRLSSSYNSLSMSSSNKPDDSIFITQAMSHDALLTREISDFYNVPIDSDIYAFPVDMIQQQQQNDKDCQRRHMLQNNNNINIKNKHKNLLKIHDMATPTTTSHDDFGLGLEHSRSQHNKLARRINRQKRKKRVHANCIEDTDADGIRQLRSSVSTCSSGKYRTPVHCIQTQDHAGSDDNGLLSDEVATITTTITTNAIGSCSGNMEPHEPLHMTLDEVKQFYHTLYSDGLTTTTTTMTMTTTQRNSASGTLLQRVQQCSNTNATKSSNETIWSGSSTHSRSKHAVNSNNNNINNNNNNNNVNNNNVNNNNNQNVGNKQLTKVKQKVNESNNNSNCISNHNHSSHVSTIEEHKQQAHTQQESGKKSQFTLNLKQKFCSIFRFRKNYRSCRSNSVSNEAEENANNRLVSDDKRKKFQSRALPPLPKKADGAALVKGVVDNVDVGLVSGVLETLADPSPTVVEVSKKSESRAFQFTSSIEKVKDYGWYWGPLSSEAAEKVLSNEPDGSFIVRDSSDDHYIFSLSFKLNNCVRHVRIEQDQGTFSFGSYAKFKSQTITEFIEKAVEHSRSGRYLFFLHRRPEHGPMRVQLTNPVSRFKHVQSLQHMCRFVILKTVIRKDLIQTLPLPRRLLDYLNYKHCYSEQVESDSAHSQTSGDASI